MDDDCPHCGQLIDERDRAHEAADQLVDLIEHLLGVDCGEHSNLNCPWTNAIEFATAVVATRATVSGEPLPPAFSAVWGNAADMLYEP